MLSPTSSYASSQPSSPLHQSSRHSLFRRSDGVNRSPVLLKRHPEPTDEENTESGALKHFSTAAFRRLVNAVKKSTPNDAPICASGQASDATPVTACTTGCVAPAPTPELRHSSSGVIAGAAAEAVPRTPVRQSIPDDNPLTDSDSDIKHDVRAQWNPPTCAASLGARAVCGPISITHPCAEPITPPRAKEPTLRTLTEDVFHAPRTLKGEQTQKTATSVPARVNKTNVSSTGDERTPNASSKCREQVRSVPTHVKHHGFARVVTTAIVADSESARTSAGAQSARKKVGKPDRSVISRRIKRQKEAESKHAKRIAGALEQESSATRRAIRLAEISKRISRKQTQAVAEKSRRGDDDTHKSERRGVDGGNGDDEHIRNAVGAQQETARHASERATEALGITAHRQTRGSINQPDSIIKASPEAAVTRQDDIRTSSNLSPRETAKTSAHNSVSQQPAICDAKFLHAGTGGSAGGLFMDRSPGQALSRSRNTIPNQYTPVSFTSRSRSPQNTIRFVANLSDSECVISDDANDYEDDVSTIAACLLPDAATGSIDGKEIGQGNEDPQRPSDNSDLATRTKERCNHWIPQLGLASGSSSMLSPGVVRDGEPASVNQFHERESECATEKRAMVIPMASESFPLCDSLNVVDTSANAMNRNQSLSPELKDGDRMIASIARDGVHMSDMSAVSSSNPPHYALHTVSSNRKLECVRTPRVMVLRNSDGTPKAPGEVFRAFRSMGNPLCLSSQESPCSGTRGTPHQGERSDRIGFPLSSSFESNSLQSSVSSLHSHPCTPRSRIPSPRSDPTPSAPSNAACRRFSPPSRIPAKRSTWWSEDLCDSPRTKPLEPPIRLRGRSQPVSPRLSTPSCAMSLPLLHTRILTRPRSRAAVSSKSRDSSCERDSTTSVQTIQRSYSLPPRLPLPLPLRSSGQISSIGPNGFARRWPAGFAERWQIRLAEVSRLSLPCFASTRPALLRTLPTLSLRLPDHVPSTPALHICSALSSKATLTCSTPRSQSASSRRPLRAFSLFPVTLPRTPRLCVRDNNLPYSMPPLDRRPPRCVTPTIVARKSLDTTSINNPTDPIATFQGGKNKRYIAVEGGKTCVRAASLCVSLRPAVAQ